jgi:hypothetical protein
MTPLLEVVVVVAAATCLGVFIAKFSVTLFHEPIQPHKPNATCIT